MKERCRTDGTKGANGDMPPDLGITSSQKNFLESSFKILNFSNLKILWGHYPKTPKNMVKFNELNLY